MNIQTLTILMLIALAFSTSGYASSNEEKVEWPQVPAKVQQTITEHAQGGEVLKVEKETKRNAVVYEAKVKKADGKKIEIKVDENGKLIEIEDD